MPINPTRPSARQASPPAYRPEQPYSSPPPSLQGVIADVRAMLQSPGRISDDMVRDLQVRWDACALESRALHVPPVLPRSTPVPAPAPARVTACLGCGGPIDDIGACRYCLRRS